MRRMRSRRRGERGLRELLKLLGSHPELANAIVFDPARVKRLLKTQAARRLLVGVDAGTLLRSVSYSTGETPLALCMQLTAIVVPPIPCPGNTKTLPTCPGNTKTLPTCPGNTKITPTCPGNTKYATT